MSAHDQSFFSNVIRYYDQAAAFPNTLQGCWIRSSVVIALTDWMPVGTDIADFYNLDSNDKTNGGSFMKAKMKEPTDIQIRYAVLDQLSKDPKVRSTEIGVGTSHGVITLSGYVYKDEERIEAENIARKVTGVLEVANDIQVRPHTVLNDSYNALKQIDSQEPSEGTRGSKL